MKTQPYHIVRNSKIHGKGVFAKRPIRKGTKIIEYTGDIISSDEADKIGVPIEGGHSHTMFFSLDKDRVIYGNTGGDAKYINHSCNPNSEGVQYDDKIFIVALRSIPKGEELTYDYHLIVDGKIDKKVMKEYACFCGSANCRGTQIDAEQIKKYLKKEAKKKAKAEKAKAKAEKAKEKKAKKAKAKAEKAKAKQAKKAKKAKAKDKNNGSVTEPVAATKKKDKKKKKDN